MVITILLQRIIIQSDIKRTLMLTETTLSQITGTTDSASLDLEKRFEKHKAL